MGILTRFLLFLFALVSVVAGGTLMVIAARLFPEPAWLAIWNQYAGRPETLAGLGIYLVVALLLLVRSVSFEKSSEVRRKAVALSSSATGSVDVATAAVQGVAERTARSLPSVRDVRADVHMARKKDGTEQLRLSLRLVLGTEVPVKDVTSAVEAAVRDELSRLLGLDDVGMKIAIEDITSGKLPHQPRVS